MAAPLYEITNLRRRFGERDVLNIPALTLETGTIYGLLGPNGAGKTTLMRLLAFMDTPTEGDIRFKGQRTTPDIYPRLRGKVVWVPQSPVLFSGSLLYNVEYPMRLKRVPGGQRKETALQLLRSVGLDHLAEAPAQKLSGGEAQRGSIARALAAGAEVLLFDEPTASVDFRSRAEIIRLVERLWQERGLSIIVTTHDRDLADALCREQIALFDGMLVSQTSKKDIVRASQPGGALSAELTVKDGVVLIRPAGSPQEQAVFSEEDKAGTLVTIEVRSDGILLRLSLAQGRTLDLSVVSPESLAIARQLTLETHIRIAR